LCKNINFQDLFVWEDLLQENNKIYFHHVNFFLWWNDYHELYFWVSFHHHFCMKSKLWDQKLINERLCKSQKIISHFSKKVMWKNYINFIFQKVWGFTSHYSIHSYVSCVSWVLAQHGKIVGLHYKLHPR